MDEIVIDGYKLDNYQMESIKSNKNTLVVAGAGSGKTSTILGKIKYLITLGYKEEDILCISLTNEATNSLKRKIECIGYNIDCYTFHKLGLNIIKKYNNVSVIDDDYLEYIVDEYFFSIVKYSYRKYYLLLVFKKIKYSEIIDSKEFLLYKKTIVTFINLLKNKGLDINYIFELYNESFLKYKYLFILEIYYIYSTELSSTNRIDLNDMIRYATYLVEENKLKLKYKYIIIDEFQDTSIIRLDLIKAIMKYNNSKLMCVGDDYQSIYRFAGSDISLFLNFKSIIKDSSIMYLKNTYRNSKEILYVSTNFICKNKYQFKKELYSNKSNKKPIKILFYKNKFKALEYVLSIIDNDYIILGRNNSDILKYSNNNYKYMTIHKSKGLEFNNVIIINLSNDILGLPTKIKNNKIIDSIMDKELYPYDEERRLFYVALTRTKHNVYLLVDREDISIFVKELIRDYKEYIEYIKRK